MSQNFGEIEFVLKGGQPWGFKLRANSDKRSSVIVAEITFGGRADQQGGLKVGDHLIKINDILCLSLADAQQLIDSAFRTLTVLVWRSKESFEDDIYLAPNSLQKCVRKSNYVPCQPFFKCFSALSIYNNCNDTTYEEQLLSNKEKSSVETNTYKNTMKRLQNSISTYSNNFQISANKMTVFCAPNVSSSKNSENSNFIPEFSKGSRNIHYCNEKSSLPLREMYLKDIPHLKNKLYFTHSPIISEHNLKLNSVVSHCNQSLISSIQVQNSAVISETFGENSYHCSKNDIPVSKPIKSCCMYPNCHNKHINCTIHSLPERDIAHPMHQSIKQIKCHSNFLHVPETNSKYRDQNDVLLVKKSSYENCTGNLSSVYSIKENQMFHKNINQKDVKLLNLNDEFSIPSSNMHTEFEFENITASSISKPMSNSQSIYLNDQYTSSKSHFSVCYFDDIFNKNLRAVSESSLPPNYVNVDDLNKKVFFNQLPRNSSVQLKETNRHAFHSVTNSLSSPASSIVTSGQTFPNYEQFDEPHNSSSTNKNGNVARVVSSDAEEDEELCLIEENKVSCYTTPNSSVTETPPLPPPPPLETEIEISTLDDALPPPPFFLNEYDCPNANKMSSITETIYENLEMVQIHCSLVNSSTQTTLDKQTNFFTESSEVMRNHSLHIKKASPHLERKYTQSKLQPSTFFTKSMLHDQNEKSSKNSLSLPLTSAYFTTSTPKAKFLTRYTSKVQLKNEAIGKELSNKKDELMSSITSKVDILLQEQAFLQEEMQQNDELGYNLVAKLEKCAKLNEVGKFKVHIEEVEKITNLLLSLSGRLARTKTALLILPSVAATEEKNLLEDKLCKLNQQYNEAIYLQENINQRSNQFFFTLNKYLTEEECADYKHFIKMKVKLLMDYKELVEKIKLGNEQLSALRSTIKTMDI